ncbi:1,5-anhydro-D-fructose reductase-like [Rhodnius prolixus]|uniref:1,5-anhydro-D-fructose reductase-like n=1 Tax=Rhodnius prolixus TaxID=13249 RepID=UPI003D187886
MTLCAKIAILLEVPNFFNTSIKRTIWSNISSIFNNSSDDKCGPKLECSSKIQTKGMCMPIYGLGTWQLHPCQVESILRFALDVGIRHIDTAHCYGNEEEIGNTLSTLFSCGKYERDELFISSKLPFYGMCPDLVNHYVCGSLQSLKLDYFDLYMIHFPVGVIEECGEYCPDPHTNHIAIWKALEDEVHKGRIKSLGLSNFNLRQLINIQGCALIPPAALQMELHAYCQQNELREYCALQGIGVSAYGPLGSPGLESYINEHQLSSNNVPSPLQDYVVQKIAYHHHKTPAQILLRFLLQTGAAVVTKSSKPDRVYRNFCIFDFELTASEMRRLCRLDKGEKGRMFSKNVWIGTENHIEYPFPPC